MGASVLRNKYIVLHYTWSCGPGSLFTVHLETVFMRDHLLGLSRIEGCLFEQCSLNNSRKVLCDGEVELRISLEFGHNTSNGVCIIKEEVSSTKGVVECMKNRIGAWVIEKHSFPFF